MYIPSIDAKDLYLASNVIDTEKSKFGYRLQTRSGKVNLNKYTNVFDDCLDLRQLENIASKILPKKDALDFYIEGKRYSNKIINVTFKYSGKEFNKLKSNTYIQIGYDLPDAKFVDCLGYNSNGDIIGVITNSPVSNPQKRQLPDSFKLGVNSTGHDIYMAKNVKANKGVGELRTKLYKDGFQCEGRHYVRYKRSSGSARVGKCLFIDAALYPYMHKWEMCNLIIENDDEVDLAALEAYISLPTSSIIDTITIEPQNILVIPDKESRFKEDSIVTKIGKDGWLHTSSQEIEVHNSLFDGQSLIDQSIMGSYSDKGMLLLRNRFFKSCCFNTNIMKWFYEKNISQISQLHPDCFTLATSIDQIKLITTPSSIKYIKFGRIIDWLRLIESTFGIVKHEKKTHYLDSQMVQAHYQLLNTVQLSEEQVKIFLADTLDYLNYLNTDVDVLKHHIECECLNLDEVGNIDTTNLHDRNKMMYTMLNICPQFTKTKMFYDFKRDLCKSFMKNAKKGHIWIDGNYSVLFGNPYEMLLHSIGKLPDGLTTLPQGNIHTSRFDFGKTLLGCRSPHISTSNILITKNMEHQEIDRYFNLTPEIVCINSVNENILERLSGADFDSDQIIISDNQIIIDAALRYYDIFKVPANHVDARKVLRKYNAEQKADLDYKTGSNLIGDIINLSQELNTIMWDIINRSKETDPNKLYTLIEPIYIDICQLNVMSCIEIDKAKKEFDVNMEAEIARVRKKWLTKDFNGRVIKPGFIGYIAKTKGYYNPTKKHYKYHKTTMDYILKELSRRRAKKQAVPEFISLSKCFSFPDYNKDLVNKQQLKKIVTSAHKANKKISSIYANTYIKGDVKYTLATRERDSLLYLMQNMKINKHTMCRLISYTDAPQHKDISKLLFRLIFAYDFDAIFDIVNDMVKFVTYIEPDRDGGLYLCGKPYTRKEKKIND